MAGGVAVHEKQWDSGSEWVNDCLLFVRFGFGFVGDAHLLTRCHDDIDTCTCQTRHISRPELGESDSLQIRLISFLDTPDEGR